MLTWQIDRVLRSGPLCALATFVVPIAMALLVNAVSSIDDVLALMLVASGVIFIGGLTGSVVAGVLGCALFGLGSFVAEVPVAILLLVGSGLFATLMLQDLAGSFRRAPRINAAVWGIAATTTAVVATISAALFTLTWIVSRLATWQTIVVPFGIAALGFAAKLAADSHLATTRQLTAKRAKRAE